MPTASTELSLLQAALLGVGFPLQYSLWCDCSSPLSSAGVSPPRHGPKHTGHTCSFSPCPREDFPQKGLWQGSWGCPFPRRKGASTLLVPSPRNCESQSGEAALGSLWWWPPFLHGWICHPCRAAPTFPSAAAVCWELIPSQQLSASSLTPRCPWPPSPPPRWHGDSIHHSQTASQGSKDLAGQGGAEQ